MRAFWFVLKERIDREWPRRQIVVRPLPAPPRHHKIAIRRRAAVLSVCSLNTIPGRPRFIVVFEAAFAQQKSWPRFGFECDLSDIAA